MSDDLGHCDIIVVDVIKKKIGLCGQKLIKFKNGTYGCYRHNRKQFHRKPNDGDVLYAWEYGYYEQDE